MKTISALATMAVIALLVTACGESPGAQGPVSDRAPAGGSTAPRTFETQTSDAGNVVVDVTPLSLSGETDTWDFKVGFNTHSVNLAFDPAATSVLRCDQGQEFQPIAWEGSGPGGHHRSGVISFTNPGHPVSSVELVIKGVAQVPERLFAWQVPGSMAASANAGDEVPAVTKDGPPLMALSGEKFDYGEVAMSQGQVARQIEITNSGGSVLRITDTEPT